MTYTLNDAQKKAVAHDSGPAIVLAGAGSGKTSVLTHRTAWLLNEKKVSPNSIMVVTFTNKAAGEIRDRIKTLTGQELPYSGTFHSLCARILRREASWLNLDHNFTIYDSDDQMTLLKNIYKKHGISPKDFHPKKAKNAISEAKNELLTPSKYAELAQTNSQEKSAQIYRWYQQELAASSALDFDDLLMETVRMLTTVPQVKEKYQTLIEHVLIDEYQDTNTAQYQLSKLMAAPQNNLFVVGDFSQSIYAWRGANYRNMMTLKDDFPEVTEYRLEQNYRSTQTILDTATHLIKHNSTHPVLDLWTEQELQDPIQLIESPSNIEEAQSLAREIAALHRDQMPLAEIAVLYRTNAQSRSIEEALLQFRIPYQIVGGLSFYERKEIKDVLAYLRIFVNPADSVSKQRAEKIGKRRLQKVLDMLEKKQDKTVDPTQLLQDILEASKYLEKYDSNDPDDAARIENVEELLNVASQFRESALFLENIALVQDRYMNDVEDLEQQTGVSLMSLHTAKGLEFDVVFLAGMEDGLLPHSRSIMELEKIEEERRLAYVGITRARKKLYLSYARKRLQYGSFNPALRSRFLQEIPAELFAQLPSFSTGKQNSHSSERRVVIDEDDLDAVLSGEIDIDSFLARD